MLSEAMKLADIHLRSVDQSMRSVEQKAATLLTISLALFSFSLTVLPKAIFEIETLFKAGGIMILLAFLIVALFFTYSILSIMGIRKLIRVISPKLIPTLNENSKKKKSLIYFDDFKSMQLSSFRDEWHKIEENDVLNEIIDRVYFTGLLLSDKYKKIKEAVNLLEFAGLFAIFFIITVYLLDIKF